MFKGPYLVNTNNNNTTNKIKPALFYHLNIKLMVWVISSHQIDVVVQ